MSEQDEMFMFSEMVQNVSLYLISLESHQCSFEIQIKRKLNLKCVSEADINPFVL